jgi:thiol-disulfide isomerase/thioredoxin
MKFRSFLVCFILLLGTKITTAQVNLLSLDQLESRFKQGKDTVYMVNFWATWCAPCIKELPYFEKLNVSYKDSPLKVILLSVDFKSKLETAVIPFVKRNNLKAEVFLLNEKSEQEYIERVSKKWAGSLPATWIVNAKTLSCNFYEQEFTFDELEKVYLRNR